MSSSDKVVAVIPARFGSSRFPGKPLALIDGRPMIQWTYEKAASSSIDHVIVATDDQRIFDCVEEFGGKAVMTSSDHPTGTDRIAEAIRDLEADIIVNLQGDEPLVPSAVIDQLVAAMQADAQVGMATVAVPVPFDSEEAGDPNCVKVVCAEDGSALYFSRSTLPFYRNSEPGDSVLTHWGVYAYRRQLLEDFVTWPQGRLEKAESLEQLRALEKGVKIQVIKAEEKTIGVDVPDDINKIEKLLRDKK